MTKNLLVFTDDEIRRVIPNGSEEAFIVIDPKFFSKMSGIPGHFQIKVRKMGTFPRHQGRYYSISVSGENIRVNLHSTESSTNTVNNSGVFSDLINAIEGRVQDASQKAVLVDGVNEMEKAKGTGGFAAAYSKFIGEAANHIAVITPFLPALSTYFTG